MGKLPSILSVYLDIKLNFKKGSYTIVIYLKEIAFWDYWFIYRLHLILGSLKIVVELDIKKSIVRNLNIKWRTGLFITWIFSNRPSVSTSLDLFTSLGNQARLLWIFLTINNSTCKRIASILLYLLNINCIQRAVGNGSFPQICGNKPSPDHLYLNYFTINDPKQKEVRDNLLFIQN